MSVQSKLYPYGHKDRFQCQFSSNCGRSGCVRSGVLTTNAGFRVSSVRIVFAATVFGVELLPQGRVPVSVHSELYPQRLCLQDLVELLPQ